MIINCCDFQMELACGANGQDDQADGANFEADPSLRVGISIQNLVKVITFQFIFISSRECLP